MTGTFRRKYQNEQYSMKENERISSSKMFSICFMCLILLVDNKGYGKALYKAMEIFPLVKQHVHGSTVVELPNGDILAAWFQGSGERWADDVAIMGARLKAGKKKWSKPFVMADVPDFSVFP